MIFPDDRSSQTDFYWHRLESAGVLTQKREVWCHLIPRGDWMLTRQKQKQTTLPPKTKPKKNAHYISNSISLLEINIKFRIMTLAKALFSSICDFIQWQIFSVDAMPFITTLNLPPWLQTQHPPTCLTSLAEFHTFNSLRNKSLS